VLWITRGGKEDEDQEGSRGAGRSFEKVGLSIHLSCASLIRLRFKYQEEEGKYIKLNYRVAWPFELRLFNTVDDFTAADGRPLDRLYELWAIVVHIGG
jgi:hypothetical protein